MKKERFEAVQALRFLCFIGVFLDHSGIAALTEKRFLVLVIFYMMSGFLMVYSYSDREIPCSLRGCALFSARKIRKLYPLHVETALLQYLMQTILYVSLGYPLLKVLTGNKSLLRLGVNLALLQAWVPDIKNYVLSFNGPSWFLSSMVFLYFLFPWILRLIKKLSSPGKLLAALSLCMALAYLAVCVVGIRTGFEGDVFLWLTNYCPVVRAVDFFAGCVMGYLFLHYRKAHPVERKEAPVFWTVTELAVLIIVFFFDYGMQFGTGERAGEVNPYLKALTESSCVFPILTAFPCILIFVLNRGAVTGALRRKSIVYLGDIAMYLYLLHYPYMVAWNYIELATGFTARGWGKALVVLIQFALTLLSGILYDRVRRKRGKATG